MWNVMKKRKGYVGQGGGAPAPAPAPPKKPGLAVVIGVGKPASDAAPAAPSPDASATPGGMTPDDHAQASDLHRRLSGLYGKYVKPGTDTIPHTASVPQGDKNELSDEIDMKR